MTQAIFDTNQNNINVMEMFASGKFVIGNEYPIGCKKAKKNVSALEFGNCCGKPCPSPDQEQDPNAPPGHHECVLCNCVFIPD